VCVKSAISPSSAGGSASTCLSTVTEFNKGLTVWMAIVKPPKLSTSDSRYSAGYLTIGVDESPSPSGWSWALTDMKRQGLCSASARFNSRSV
jgi:hypothetical protein